MRDNTKPEGIVLRQAQDATAFIMQCAKGDQAAWSKRISCSWMCCLNASASGAFSGRTLIGVTQDAGATHAFIFPAGIIEDWIPADALHHITENPAGAEV
jgi:hypothetical protein